MARAAFVEGDASARATFVEGEARKATFVEGPARTPTFAEGAASFTPPAGPRYMIGGSSLTPIGGAGTRFISIGGSAEEHRWSTPSPFTARRLGINRQDEAGDPAPPGPGCSITYTLRKNGQDTAIVVVLGANDSSGSSPIDASVDFLAGDFLSVKQVRSGPCSTAYDEWLLDHRVPD